MVTMEGEVMRLVDRGLQAITAPTPAASSSSTGVAALAAVAGLAVLGAAKRFRDPFRNLPIFDFGNRNAYHAMDESREQYLREMKARGIAIKEPLRGDACRVWADWAVEQGHLAGEAWNAGDADVPHVRVQRDARADDESVQCLCDNTSPVPPENTPRVIRGLLDRLGYDGKAIVPLEGWEERRGTDVTRQSCRTSPVAQSIYIDYNAPHPLWPTKPGHEPAPLSKPYNYVMVAAYHKKLPCKVK